MKLKSKIPLDTRRGVKWLFRLLSGIGISVVYYFFFSLFFDTPIEYEIKQSNQKLEEQYIKLDQRYDSVSSVLNNIVDRDRGIHRILFESDPYTAVKDSTMDKAQMYETLLDKSNMELGDELINRTGQLYQRVFNVTSQLNSTQKYFKDNRDKINAIPAIQPIHNPDLTLLTASYGNRIHPFYKSMKMHPGVDFSVPIGTAVFATADGIVDEIRTKGQSSGTSITLKHTKQYSTLYGNLSQVLVSAGQIVNRGDIIAFSGNTGLSFAPHLHYEVRLRGKAVDPIDYFFLEVDIRNQGKLRSIAAAGMQAFD